MATTRHITYRIKSIRNIQHITKAMKMVAAARLKRATSRLEAARPYARKLAEVTLDLVALNAGGGNALLNQRTHPQRALIVLFTGDRGLCGGFHERVVQEGIEHARRLAPLPADFFVIGRQGARIMRRLKQPVIDHYLQQGRGLIFGEAKALAGRLIEYFRDGRYDRVDLVFSRYYSPLRQKPRVFELLPVTIARAKQNKTLRGAFLFEPSPDEVLAGVVDRYVASVVFRAFLEGETGELGARMTAMTNATDNAGEIISHLVLDYNRARQALITREISEIVGGAEAIK